MWRSHSSTVASQSSGWRVSPPGVTSASERCAQRPSRTAPHSAHRTAMQSWPTTRRTVRWRRLVQALRRRTQQWLAAQPRAAPSRRTPPAPYGRLSRSAAAAGGRHNAWQRRRQRERGAASRKSGASALRLRSRSTARQRRAALMTRGVTPSRHDRAPRRGCDGVARSCSVHERAPSARAAGEHAGGSSDSIAQCCSVGYTRAAARR
jgi:hypothetical protein